MPRPDAHSNHLLTGATVAITYLHHTHPDLPHYDAKHWTFVKGSLATVDRDFGFIGRNLFHGIIETHVVHHLFSYVSFVFQATIADILRRIPFYYADEATEAIKPVLGNLYHCESSFISKLQPTFRECKYVEKNEAVPGQMTWAKTT